MSDKVYKEIIINKIITEQTRKVGERLGHFNDLDLISFSNDLSPEEHIKVLEEVLRNVIRICESRLKNTFSRKERYAKKIASQIKNSTLTISKKPDGWIPSVGKFD